METKLRSVLKTLSWRTTALFITAIVTYVMTRRWEMALALGTSDTLVKLVLYYLHERLWNLVPRGRLPDLEQNLPPGVKPAQSHQLSSDYATALPQPAAQGAP